MKANHPSVTKMVSLIACHILAYLTPCLHGRRGICIHNRGEQCTEREPSSKGHHVDDTLVLTATEVSRAIQHLPFFAICIILS